MKKENKDNNNKLYLTFDFDWAPENLILNLVDYLDREGVIATFYITNQFEGLDQLKETSHCLGIHPNFTPLPVDQIYHSDFISNASNIINDLFSIVPNAKTTRSHGLTTNTRIFNLLMNRGITHESNLFIPLTNNIELIPFYHYNGLINCPYFFEDDLYCEELKIGKRIKNAWDPSVFLDRRGLKIFDFHPIHIALNTEDMEMYYRYRESHDLESNINHSPNSGSRVFLQNLIALGKQRGFEFDVVTNIEVK